MGSLLGRDEIRRLQKAARDSNKQKLTDWVYQFEGQMDTLIRKGYEQHYEDEIANSVSNFLIAIAYTAYFSEESKVDKDNIADYMADLFATIDMFRTGEYTPKEYKDELEKCGVMVDDVTGYDYNKIYKDYIGTIDSSLVQFVKHKNRKIVTICANREFKNEIEELQQDLTVQGYFVFIDGVYSLDDLLPEEINQLVETHKDKILISDIVYVINKDNKVDETTQKEIDYAIEHNKKIIYVEPQK